MVLVMLTGFPLPPPVLIPSQCHPTHPPTHMQEDLGSDTPRLRASVVQRLQRFATHGQLKQLVLRTLTEAAGVDGESAPPPIEGAQEWLRSVRVLFDELDVDSSGTVSIQELSAGLEALGFDVSPGEMEVLMARIDTDRDGGLQLSEFVASLVDWGVVQRHHAWQDWVRAVFDRLDKDGNGFITLDEIAEELGDYKGKEGGWVMVWVAFGHRLSLVPGKGGLKGDCCAGVNTMLEPLDCGEEMQCQGWLCVIANQEQASVSTPVHGPASGASHSTTLPDTHPIPVLYRPLCRQPDCRQAHAPGS